MNPVVATGQSAERVGCPVLVLKPIEDLTKRELEVLRFAAAGLTAGEIAEALYLAEVTVKKALEAARQKLGAKNTLHAVVLALAWQLIKLDTNMAHVAN